jgi:hypothetical protein
MSPGLRLLTLAAGVALLAAPERQKAPLPFSFTEIAEQAGLTATTVYGGQGTNRYLLETTGTGIAAFDYDGDGWMDIFQVNGTTLEGFPPGEEPSRLYRNRRDGTFEDVTERAGLALTGWGQGACTGDYDNDGHEDLFVTFWGTSRLFRNNGEPRNWLTLRLVGVQSNRTGRRGTGRRELLLSLAQRRRWTGWKCAGRTGSRIRQSHSPARQNTHGSPPRALRPCSPRLP